METRIRGNFGDSLGNRRVYYFALEESHCDLNAVHESETIKTLDVSFQRNFICIPSIIGDGVN